MKSTPKSGRWSKGTSGNPSGRPVGSRNKGTLFLEELLDGEGEALTRKAIQLGLKGDPFALRLCLERLLAPRKERRIDLPLPKVTEVQHAAAALASILEAIGGGKITPGEGEILAGIVEAQERVIQAETLERRVSELEKALKEDQEDRRQ